MKKFRLLSLLGVVLVAGTLAGCLNNNDVNEGTNNQWDIIIEDITADTNAVIDYNDSLVDIASSCIASEDAIWNAYNSDEFDADKVQTAIDNTLDECNSAITQIEALGGWEWDNSLKDGVVILLQKDVEYYGKIREMIAYLAISEDGLTEEQNEAYGSILAEIDTLNQELEAANNNLIEIQNQFAANHKFELEDIDEEVVAEDVVKVE